MPKYKLPNGKVIFSEKELSPEELDELVSGDEVVPSVEPNPELPQPTNFNTSPVAPEIPVVPSVEEESPWKGFFDNPIWNNATKPIADVGLNPEMRASVEEEHPILGPVMNFGTDVISGLSSPLNLATMGMFGGSAAVAGKLPQIARGLSMGGKALSLPVATHGGMTLANADSGAEALVGALELGGGILGMKSKIPQIGRSVVGDVPPIIPDNIELPLQPKVESLPTQPTASSKLRDAIKTITDYEGDTKIGGMTDQQILDYADSIKPGSTLTQPIPAQPIQPKPVSARLPQDLRGARPTFNMGPNNYIPKFANDLDKALYIIAQKNPSKRDADYLKFVMELTGLDEAAARQAGTQLRSKLKGIIKTSKPGDVDLPQLYEHQGTGTNPNVNLPKQSKPKLRLNQDATYTDTSTGEVFDINDPRLAPETEIIPPAERLSPNTAVPVPTPKQGTKFQNLINLPRSIQAAYDISFPFRQGLGLIHTKGWWTSWDDMLKSYGSEDAFRAVQESIAQRPNYQRITDAATGKSKPSFAEEAGLKLATLDDITKREEIIMSNLAEKIPGVRASNRAYTAFANKLRSDNFDALVEQAEKSAGDVAELNPRSNIILAKQIANYVNNASGRGGLGSLEKSAVELNALLFSPRLIASRLQMMNPRNYVNTAPLVRKQYLKSMLAIAGTWTTMASLAKMAGADVSLSPTSSDFGKIKIGNTRFDPAGGFQQYLVLFSRLINQGRTAADSEKFTPYGKGYKAPTFGEDLTKFIRNKLAPVPAFASDPFFANERFPFEVGDRSLRLFAPIILQDLSELAQEDPMLIPGLIPAAVGLGTQTFGEREPSRLFGDFFPRENDIQFPKR